MDKFATLSVHSGTHHDQHGAVMPPIYATSTYVQPAPGEHPVMNIRAAATRRATRWSAPSRSLRRAARDLRSPPGWRPFPRC